VDVRPRVNECFGDEVSTSFVIQVGENDEDDRFTCGDPMPILLTPSPILSRKNALSWIWRRRRRRSDGIFVRPAQLNHSHGSRSMMGTAARWWARDYNSATPF
jgi:hypothetical protein